MIKVKILKDHIIGLGKIAGFVVKENTTYAIVVVANKLFEFELDELVVEN